MIKFIFCENKYYNNQWFVMYKYIDIPDIFYYTLINIWYKRFTEYNGQ